MDPPGEPNNSPKDEPNSQMSARDEDKEKGKGKGKEVDKSSCYAISSSKDASGLNVPSSSFATDIDALWPHTKAQLNDDIPELDPDGGSWCDDELHDHERAISFLINNAPSTSSLPRFPMERNICGEDMEAACSEPTDYRQFQFPSSNLGQQETLEQLLAESWVQLGADEIENYSQNEFFRHFQEDLDLMFDLEALMPPQQSPTFENHPQTPNESAETISSRVSIGDTDHNDVRDSDPAIVMLSAQSLGGNVQSDGMLKRKSEQVQDGGETDDVTGASGSAQQQEQEQQSIPSRDTLQKKHKLVPDRPTFPRMTRPRHGIQTRTEVDVIDDGYKWRKYGQKPVKNSNHPRNYYRCTTPDCPVRKRVERLTEDPSHVLTTYNGIHTHPENSTHSRESNPRTNTISTSNAEVADPSLPPTPINLVSPQQPAPLAPPRLPPLNYIHPTIISHLLEAGSQVSHGDQRRWSHPPLQASSSNGGGRNTFFQRNLNLLRLHHFFRLHYGTQYPLLTNMLHLMRNFPQARQATLLDPQLDPRLDSRLDPIATLMAAQTYFVMQSGGNPIQNANLGSVGVALDNAQHGQQHGNLSGASPRASLGTTSTVKPSGGPSNTDQVSIQQRLLWMQELMGENLLSEVGRPPVQQTTSNNSREGKEDPQDDVGDPP